jgi:aminopeptidase N
MAVVAARWQLWESAGVSLTAQHQRCERPVRRGAAYWLAASLTLSFTSWACSEERVVQTVELREGVEEQGHAPECSGDTCSETAPESRQTGGPQVAQSGHDAGIKRGVDTAGTDAKPSAGKGAAGTAGAKPVQPRAAGTTAVAQNGAKPGDSGLGDPDYVDYGNGGYNVSHYDIRLRYTPSEDRLAGVTTITLTPSMQLSRFNLDFVLAVSAVTVNGERAMFAREGQHELVITPISSLPEGTEVQVVVSYEDVPSRVRVQGLRRTGWWRTADGAIGAGAPENAWWWYPSNDHPMDKATHAVTVTVPEGVTVVSNGLQTMPPMAANPGWLTWSWRSSKPQQPYVSLLVIGDYELVERTTESGLPAIYAYSKRVDTASARPTVELTEEIVRWEETLFGPYPFEAMGGVVAPNDGISYALETQTRPIYPVGYFGRGAGATMIAHESAHQWFGDSTAIKYWRDVWLSEGFATYAEWLYSEEQGTGTAQELFDANYSRYAPNDAFWQFVVGNPGKERVFDVAVYNRGAMTLHQLRLTVGDDKFFEILRMWSDARRHSNGSTDDFRALCELISGKPLEDFFDAWLFTAGRPKLEAASSARAESASFAPLPVSWAAIAATQTMHPPL